MQLNYCITLSEVIHERSLTSMEHPIRAPFFDALCMIWNKSLGALSRSSWRAATPPVKSVKASTVRPPLNASYDPFNLETVEQSINSRLTFYQQVYLIEQIQDDLQQRPLPKNRFASKSMAFRFRKYIQRPHTSLTVSMKILRSVILFASRATTLTAFQPHNTFILICVESHLTTPEVDKLVQIRSKLLKITAIVSILSKAQVW